jgi:outer membrane receptor protein involved in Fe transport
MRRFACQASLVVLALAPLALWHSVRADDEQAQAAAAPASAEEAAAASVALKEVVVTATRRSESLSKVPISVTALTQESLDDKGIKDFSEVARFTPGVHFDTSGTNNIAIRGISGSGGAGTTGIYLDDTPIQMRALAFNPDDALPKAFDIDRVEVLRGPQGTLFGAGSEGGTVRYITTQPSLSKTSIYGRAEVAYTEGGDPSVEGGVAAGGPLIEGTLGARVSLWYRHDGGWIDHIDPYTLKTTEKNSNYVDTYLVRVSALWAPSEQWSLTPLFYYQNQQRNDIDNYWSLYSDPSRNNFVDADPSRRPVPDTFYIGSLKIEGDLGPVQLISNTAYYERHEQTGYEGTLYNLGFYQAPSSLIFTPDPVTLTYPTGAGWPLLDANGVHAANGLHYYSPSNINNDQRNITEEIRLQSADPNARFIWTTGLFFTHNHQSYLEQIHDPQLNDLSHATMGVDYTDGIFVDINGNPVPYVADFPNDSYFLQTNSIDEQYAIFGEGTYSFSERWKLTAGARYSRNKYSFDTYTGGPQLFAPPTTGSGNNAENAFTPKVSVQFQANSNNMYYATYAKGFRPGGANNPLPPVACGEDFITFGISAAPTTYNSDTVDSYEIGAKNNINNRVRLASSVYWIKWNNIQQTVVPPICQISFIDNLGQAVAKGLDLQLDAQLTDHLSLELSFGYTDARYTQDSRLSASEAQPIVAKGNAILGVGGETGAGQPAAPVTVAAGLEYRFGAFSHEAFVRVDSQYLGRAKWPTAPQDPNTLQYDPANFVLPGYTLASVRAGFDVGAWSLSAFCDNVTNVHPLTAYDYTIDNGISSRLGRSYTVRPLTFGITAIFHGP